MIPTDEDINRFFATATPIEAVAESVMGSSRKLDHLCGENIPSPACALRWLRMTTQDGAPYLQARAWVDEKELSAADYRTFAESPQPDDTFESWQQRCIRGRQFAIVASGLEAVDEALARAVARYLSPSVRRQRSLAPVSVGCFIGQYDFTPLGVHKDKKATALVHFHLGPGGKQLLFWENGNNLPAGTGYPPLSEDVIASANSINANAGDGLIVAHADYHIGRAADSGASLVLLFKNVNPATLVERVRRDLMWPRNPRTDWGEPILHLGTFVPESWLNLTTRDMYQTALNLWQMALRSNGGLEAPPVPLTQNLPPRVSVRVTDSDVFPLLFRQEHGRLVVAARSRLRAWTSHTVMTHWLDRLAAGEVMTTETLQQTIADKAIAGEAIMCLTWLYQMRAVTIEHC